MLDKSLSPNTFEGRIERRIDCSIRYLRKDAASSDGAENEDATIKVRTNGTMRLAAKIEAGVTKQRILKRLIKKILKSLKNPVLIGRECNTKSKNA